MPLDCGELWKLGPRRPTLGRTVGGVQRARGEGECSLPPAHRAATWMAKSILPLINRLPYNCMREVTTTWDLPNVG